MMSDDQKDKFQTAGYLLELLVCPISKTTLKYDAERHELVSRVSGLAFPIRDGVPVMIVSEARELSAEEKMNL